MKTNIIKNIIHIDKLNEQINMFEMLNSQQAYLFMHRATIDYLENTIPAKELCINDSSCRHSDVIAKFKGRNVYIDDDLKFGEVEIR